MSVLFEKLCWGSDRCWNDNLPGPHYHVDEQPHSSNGSIPRDETISTESISASTDGTSITGT